MKVRELTADSRAVGPGDIFAALRGSLTDGRRFIPDAVAKGAGAVLIDAFPELGYGDDVAFLIAKEPRLALARMAARLYVPQPESVVAVTGTAGKTSVATFARQIMAAGGHRAASVGTVGVTIGDRTEYGNLTTPDPVALHRILQSLAGDGVTHLAMEASSHGLDQFRLDGVRIKAAAFTNLGRDHLDYHPTLEDYRRAKLGLFERVVEADGWVVANADSSEFDHVRACAERRGLRLLSVGEQGEDIRIASLDPRGSSQDMAIAGTCGEYRLRLPLAGAFQASNALVAAGLAIAVGVPHETAFAALETLKGADGRLDHVLTTDAGADIYVDYAHKPEALSAALAALRPFAAGRLIVVFGAGGDRDRGKRPLMGAAAKAGADRVIVTDDNPRNENPAAIRGEILRTVPDAEEIGDRAEAIEVAMRDAGQGDVVLVAGKGHEPGQIVGDMVLPFSDHAVIRAVAGVRAP